MQRQIIMETAAKKIGNKCQYIDPFDLKQEHVGHDMAVMKMMMMILSHVKNKAARLLHLIYSNIQGI